MRAREFIKEEAESTGRSSNKENGKSHGKLHPNHQNAIPELTRFNNTPAAYYSMYRFGMAIASNGNTDLDPNGPAGNQLSTVAYTEQEAEMINKGAKKMGFKGTKISKIDSQEDPDVGITSPVANWMKSK